MSTSPDLVVSCGDPFGVMGRLSVVPGLSLFYLPGFLTLEDCAAWFAGRPTLFDEIMEWCEDTNWSGRVWIDRHDTLAMMVVGIETSTDAVMFKLRWADHMSRPLRQAA
jgi:hypothetical protein